jgi:hypothetical protein
MVNDFRMGRKEKVLVQCIVLDSAAFYGATGLAPLVYAPERTEGFWGKTSVQDVDGDRYQR